MTPARADDPSPANVAAVNMPLERALSWSPGLYAATHDVYVGTNPVDVAEASGPIRWACWSARTWIVPAYDPGGLDVRADVLLARR